MQYVGPKCWRMLNIGDGSALKLKCSLYIYGTHNLHLKTYNASNAIEDTLIGLFEKKTLE
jgi:hypothetical protein